MDELIERLRREAAAWDDWNEDHPDDAAVTTPPLLREAAAALEAAREDARKWRYWANGPQGTFLTDDLKLATAILAEYDKDDDWTVTDIVDPTGAAIGQARGKAGGEVEGG